MLSQRRLEATKDAMAIGKADIASGTHNAAAETLSATAVYQNGVMRKFKAIIRSDDVELHVRAMVVDFIVFIGALS